MIFQDMNHRVSIMVNLFNHTHTNDIAHRDSSIQRYAPPAAEKRRRSSKLLCDIPICLFRRSFSSLVVSPFSASSIIMPAPYARPKVFDTNHKNAVFGDNPKNIMTGFKNLEMYCIMPNSVNTFCNTVRRYTNNAIVTTFFVVRSAHCFSITVNVSCSCTEFSTTIFSKLPGMILFNIHAKMNADNVLIKTMLNTDEPVLCCTAVSTIIL